MSSSQPLPILMPNVARQKWSCHSCGNCCRDTVVHLFAADLDRLRKQGWVGRLGDDARDPYVALGKAWVLNKRPGGACVFLDDVNRCRIHSEFGEEAKPIACRLFPFSVRPVPTGWQASLRFDCPSVTASRGQSLSQHASWLKTAAMDLEHDASESETVELTRGVPATQTEQDAIVERLMVWFKQESLPIADRLVGAARLTATLSGAKLENVRGPRFVELLELLIGALPSQREDSPDVPTKRQQAMLRQLAFVHAEHVTLDDLRGGMLKSFSKRWHQLRAAGRFRTGVGLVPRLPGFGKRITFDAVHSVAIGDEESAEIDDLLLRYVSARLESSSVFGTAYYGRTVIDGLDALWLSVAVAGWLARLAARTTSDKQMTFLHVSQAVGVVDAAATRVPALGTVAERGRIAYLQQNDGVARLLHAFRMTDSATERTTEP